MKKTSLGFAVTWSTLAEAGRLPVNGGRASPRAAKNGSAWRLAMPEKARRGRRALPKPEGLKGRNQQE